MIMAVDPCSEVRSYSHILSKFEVLAGSASYKKQELSRKEMALVQEQILGLGLVYVTCSRGRRWLANVITRGMMMARK
jgi:hypothetical protein